MVACAMSMTQAKRKDPHAPGTDGHLVRTSILISRELDQRLRELAKRGHRPLTWEIRRALEEYVARETDDVAA